MGKRLLDAKFSSALAEYLQQFVAEKRACGYRYNAEVQYLKRLDQFLVDRVREPALPRSAVDAWLSLAGADRTRRNRACLVRKFAVFLAARGVAAYVPDAKWIRTERSKFVPHIFTVAELRQFFHAVDSIPPHGLSPLRYLVMREAFRLLYGCGLRVGELLQLVVGDVNLAEGVLTIRDGKFHKDRLVAIAPSLVTRLCAYDGAIAMGRRDRTFPFFPAPSGGYYSYTTLYHTFRLVLSIAGIAHGGRGAGPRLHDFRHTFAVHRLAAWYRERADLSARMPVLSTYMGHRSLHETDCYLRLTAELYPDLATRLENAYGYVIPREVAQ